MNNEPVAMALFDYEALEQEVRIVLQQRASEIKTLAKRMASDVVEIGGKLAEVKQRLGGNGKFTSWLSAELGWSERTAYNFMAVHEKFGAANFAIENIAPSALYLLVADSTPVEARTAALEMAEAGDRVTHALAKEIVQMAKDAQPQDRALFIEPDDDAEEDHQADETAAPASQEDDSDAAEPQALPPPASTKKSAPKPAEDAKLAFLNDSTIQINLRLMPVDGDARGRHAILAITANDGNPTVKSIRILPTDFNLPPAVAQELTAFIAKEAAKKPAIQTTKAKAKTKIAKEAAKKPAIQTTKAKAKTKKGAKK